MGYSKDSRNSGKQSAAGDHFKKQFLPFLDVDFVVVEFAGFADPAVYDNRGIDSLRFGRSVVRTEGFRDHRLRIDLDRQRT